VSSQELAAEMTRGQVATSRSASFPFLEVNAMTGFSQILAVSAFLCLISPSGHAEEPVAQNATLRIQTRVYNMAKVRPAILSGALIEASEIFRRIGIEIEWVEGYSGQRLGSSQLYLRIIPRLFPNTRYALGPSHLGYAATSEEGGVLATIFFHRVEELAWGNPSYALGCAIAHELGHLLLGDDQRKGSPHSASGLMRGPWTRDDLKRKARETMQFTSEDARQLRARLLERSRKSDDLQAPPSLFTEIDTREPSMLFR
jgi:hypothetical protein